MHRRALIAVAATFAVIVALALPAFSVSNESGFQDDDANLAPTGGQIDWNSFAPTAWTGTAPKLTATDSAGGWTFAGAADAQAVTSDDGFAGGTKQDDQCPTVITQKADNKADLKRIYLSTKDVSGHTYLNLAWVRIPQNTTSPSAHVAFEFNQSTTACGVTSNGLVTRTAKDLLVVYDFEGGTDSPTIRIERWVTTGSCEISSHSVPCWGPADVLGAGEAEAAVNTGVSPYPGILTNGDGIAPNAPETLGVKEFGEAGIDLTDSGVFDANTCITFGKAYGVSRTSGNSGTAQMKDLVGPVNFSLSNCPKVNIVKTGGNLPLAGAKFELFQPAGVDGNGVPTGTSKYNCTTDADGKCTMTNVLPGTYTLDETVVPPGYTKALGLPQTVIVVSGTDQTLPFEDPPAPGRVDITKLDDAGDPVEGARFQLYSPQGIANGAPTGSAVTGKFCDTDATGSCTISNVTPGDYTLDETVIPTGYAKDADLPENITVPNGGTVTKSYTNPRKFKVIVIVCRQTDDSLYPSDITIDGAASGKSLSSAQATTAGLSESALCGISTGSKGNLRAAPDSSNPHDADIDIPNKQT